MINLAQQYIANPNSTTVQNKIGLLVWGLSDVLENAVVPMNKLGLLHLDLKGDNMLINENALDKNKMPYVKIIDWGLAGVVPKSGIAEAAKNRPLQFNAPFSNILFNGILVNNNIIQDNCYTNDINATQITSISTQIVAKMIQDWPGHAAYIAQDLQQFLRPYKKTRGSIYLLDSNTDCIIEPLTVIVEYIAAILRKYMIKNDSEGLYECGFDSEAYFVEVYRYNCDVWGLLTAFQNFIEQYTSKFMIRNDKLARAMSHILFKYCFSPTYAAERIPIKDVVEDMHKLAGICGINKRPSTENGTVPRPSPPKVSPPIVSLPIIPPISSPIAPKANKKNKLVLRQASPNTISLKGKKRCPNGYSKHPLKVGKCRKTTKKATRVKSASPTKNNTSQRVTLPLGRKRCPAGYKRIAGDGINTRIICGKK